MFETTPGGVEGGRRGHKQNKLLQVHVLGGYKEGTSYLSDGWVNDSRSRTRLEGYRYSRRSFKQKKVFNMKKIGFASSENGIQ